MKKKQFKMTRRQVLKAGMIGGAGLMMPLRFFPKSLWGSTSGWTERSGLQPKFVESGAKRAGSGIYLRRQSKAGIKEAVQNYSSRCRFKQIT